MVKNKKLLFTLVIYFILFYTAWAGFGWLIANHFFDWTGNNEIVIQIIRAGIVKNLVWTLPAFILIKHFEKDCYIGLKEMFTTKVKILDVLPVLALCIIYTLAGVFRTGDWSIVESFGWSKIIIVLTVGITEEMVFRGWLLNVAVKNADKEWKQWVAIFINAVLFLTIHFPIWLYDGVFVRNFQSFAFTSIIILSCMFSWLFIKTKNILAPIVLHMLYDLLVFMFIGG
jgi:hypothetical protein